MKEIKQRGGDTEGEPHPLSRLEGMITTAAFTAGRRTRAFWLSRWRLLNITLG